MVQEPKVAEPQSKLNGLKNLNAKLTVTDGDNDSVNSFVLQNSRKAFLAVQVNLSMQNMEKVGMMPSFIRSELEIYQEALRLAQNLVNCLDRMGEVDLIDIHFQKIIKELLYLNAILETYGDADDSRIKFQKEISDLQNDISFLFRNYIRLTGNIESILAVINAAGIDNPNVYIRFKYIQAINSIVLSSYKNTNAHRQMLSAMPHFINMVIKLINRTKADKTDSIKIEARTQLRNIIKDLAMNKEDLHGLLNSLTDGQVTSLKEIVDYENTLKRINEIEQEIDQMKNSQAVELNQFQKKLVFGAIPRDIVKRIEKSGEDRILKLRAVQDLEAVLDNLHEEMEQVGGSMIYEYSSSFIEFIDINLLQDLSYDIKILLTALKGIKLIVTPDAKNLRQKLNLPKLVNSLIRLCNDSKELIRNEMEQLIIDIHAHMPTADLVFLLMRALDPVVQLTDPGKKHILNAIMIILLKHEEERTSDEKWGKGDADEQLEEDSEDDQNEKKNPKKKKKEIEQALNLQDQNLYLKLTEPVVYLYNKKTQRPEVRFYAQETLAVMALGCNYLDTSLLMEAIFECSTGDKNQKLIYNRFCDRLETRKHAALVRTFENICTLEFPFHAGYLFSVDQEDAENNPYQNTERPFLSEINPPDQIQQELKRRKRTTKIPLKDRALQSSRGGDTHQYGQFSKQFDPSIYNEDESTQSEFRPAPSLLPLIRPNSQISVQTKHQFARAPQNNKVSLRDRSLATRLPEINRPSQEQEDEYITEDQEDSFQTYQTTPKALQRFLKKPGPLSLQERIEQRKQMAEEERINQDDYVMKSQQLPLNNKVVAKPKSLQRPYLQRRRVNSIQSKNIEKPLEKVEIQGKRKVTVSQPKKGELVKVAQKDYLKSNPILSRSQQENYPPVETPYQQKLVSLTKQRKSTVKLNINRPPKLEIEKIDSTPSESQKKQPESAQNLGSQSPKRNLSGLQTMNVSQIVGRTDKDIYLSEKGPLMFKPLKDPENEIQNAIQQGMVHKNWEVQFHACNTIRNALRFHKEYLNKANIRKIVERLHGLMESLRSQLAKNAILTLSDCFTYLPEGSMTDKEITKSYSILIKKTAETNIFIATEAENGLQQISYSTPPQKSIEFFYKFYEDKSTAIKKSIAKTLEQVMTQMGSKNISSMPTQTQSHLFKMLLFFIAANNQEVRINGKKAILTMEFGPSPLGNRQAVLRVVKASVSNEFDVNKIIQVLDKGPDDDDLIPFQDTISITSPMRKSVRSSVKKARVRNQSSEHLSEFDDFNKEKHSKSNIIDNQIQQTSGITQLKPDQPNPFARNSMRDKRANLQPIVEEYSSPVKIPDHYKDQETFKSPNPFGSVQKISKSQITFSKNNTVTKQKKDDRTKKIAELGKADFKTEVQKKTAMLELLEVCKKEKHNLINDKQFSETIDIQVVKPLSNFGSHIVLDKKYEGQKVQILSQGLIEAEILELLLPEFNIGTLVTDKAQATNIMKSLMTFQGPQNKNHRAQANSLKCFAKFVNFFHINKVSDGFFESILICHIRQKHLIVDMYTQKVEIVASKGDDSAKRNLAKTLAYLLDQVNNTKGYKTIGQDLRASTQALSQQSYRLMEGYLLASLPNESQKTLLELVR